MNKNRVNEVIASMKSFRKDKYYKDELLAEMFALQSDIVELTFNGEHASTADLKIWDVEKHMEQLNIKCGNIATDDLHRFKEGSKRLCNLIKAEVSGSRGEAKAFRSFQYIQSKKKILKNVELNDGELRSELDAVVITPGGLTIVEVKNTAKDIFIDENGDYYRTGEFLRWDCNIREKIAIKEALLRNAISGEDIKDVPINSVVVFTNNHIEVQNRFSGVRTCFTSQLPHIIDELRSPSPMTEDEMEKLEELIKSVECKEKYAINFNVEQYKYDFAVLATRLEEASAKLEEGCYENEEIIEPNLDTWKCFKHAIISRMARYAGSAVAGTAATLIATLAINGFRK